MSEVNRPFEIFRVSVPDGEYSRRADVVEKIHYDAALSQLAALREELATSKRNEHNSEVAYKAAIEKQEELREELKFSEGLGAQWKAKCAALTEELNKIMGLKS